MPDSVAQRIAEAERQAKELKALIAKREREMAPAVKAIQQSRKKLEQCLEKIGNLKVEHKLISITDMLNYHKLSPSTPYYKALKKEAAEHGISFMGVWIETGMACPQISLNRSGNNIKQQINGLLHFLPYMSTNAAGELHIALFEHDLAESASWHIILHKPTMRASLNKIRYGRETNGICVGTLEEVFRWCCNNDLWYEDDIRNVV